MCNQEELEEKLLQVCPVCKGADLVEMSFASDDEAMEYLIDQCIFDVNMSNEWDGRICKDCGISWAVCRWVSTDNDIDSGD